MKAAMYIETKIKKGPKAGQTIGWAGYIYETEEINPADYTYLRDGFDQWDQPVKIYQAPITRHLGTPGGTRSTSLAVLFDKQPTPQKVAA